MQTNELGKIEKVEFGFFDRRFGISFTLKAASGRNVDDFWGGWVSRPQHAQWTLEEQNVAIAGIWRRLIKTMEQAKANDFMNLVGKPIELTTEGMMLKSWRILTEVL